MIYRDSKALTGNNYKCVKATIKAIKKMQNNENNKTDITLFSDIKDAKIVYPTIVEKIQKLVGKRLIDAVFHLPINYELWHKVKSINEISEGNYCCIETEIVEVKKPNVPFYIAQKKHIPTTIKTITFDGYKLDLVFFNVYPNMLETFKVGKKIVCQGRITISQYGRYIMTHPHIPLKIQTEKGCIAVFKLNQLEESGENIDNFKIDKIVPIYALTEGIKQVQVVSLIEKILNNPKFDFSLLDSFDYLVEKSFTNAIPDVKTAITMLHFPKTYEDIRDNSVFRRKLAFLELLSFQYELTKARKSREQELGISINSRGLLIEKFSKNLPFSLTSSQEKCIKEIYNEQKSEKKMFRLLQGDVGSGKTIVALISALNTIESGFKVVLMAPTAILAKQHFSTIQKMYFGLGIQSELLIGETKQKVRKDIIARLELGQIDVLVGTHTLFQDKIILPKNIGLFIIDEQHNFGVEQRVKLINKCGKADILMMSATPIPRTMVMGLYGDIGVSCIEHKPANRLPIITKVVEFEEKYLQLVEAINRKVKAGEKIYWICPLVEESEKMDYIDVNTRAKEIENIIDTNKIGVLHGKMSQENKDKIMLDFKNGKYNVLVATTVIEVGIDIPDATVIVIENAEKFGLAQLHQLRGRVGRGDKQSYCFLLYGKNVSEKGIQRLEILKNHDNGFEIAELDLKMRGGGTLLNKKQSGFKTMNFVDFSRDRDILNILKTSHIENIELEKIKPIISLFYQQTEDGKNKMFVC